MLKVARVSPTDTDTAQVSTQALKQRTPVLERCYRYAMGLTLGTPASETGKSLLMTHKQTGFDVQKGLVSLLFYLSNTSKVFTAAK